MLAGTVTPDLVLKLQEAALLAEEAGNQSLADDLRHWEQRLSRALEIGRVEARKPDQPDSEMWLG